MDRILLNLRNPRLLAAFSFDIISSLLSFWLAIFLRFDAFIPSNMSFEITSRHFVLTELCLILSFIFNGLYTGLWRFSSLHDLMRVLRSSFIGVFSGLLLNLFFINTSLLPRSIYLLQFLLLVMFLGGGRFLYRFWKDYLGKKKQTSAVNENVLIVGAGVGGARIAREISMEIGLGLNIIGFVDDDPFKKGKKVHEIKVLGPVTQIKSFIELYNIDKIFVAIPSATSEQLKRILEVSEGTDVELKVLPKIDQLLGTQSGLSLLRDIKIEDLLGREQVCLDMNGLSLMIEDKVVLVSGAGGSIGSEICFQIAKFRPKNIVFFDVSEFFMYELENKFKLLFPDVCYTPIIGDVRDLLKLEQVFGMFKPSYVFHAAAYKHVPMMESNHEEAILTNVLGTKKIAETSLKFQVEKFVLISTDKAVNPTNIMGASKRLAEMTLSSIFSKNQVTKFISVRFGNVLGSNGSVIPLFKKQIEERLNLTVTHPDITRYFMSIPEASQLVLQAALLGKGGEVFVLDMGNPVRIVELARTMIKLSGLKIDRDIGIDFVGLRPGEKMFEELFGNDENILTTDHPKIKKAITPDNADIFDDSLQTLMSDVRLYSKSKLLSKIKILMPEFDHKELKIEILNER